MYYQGNFTSNGSCLCIIENNDNGFVLCCQKSDTSTLIPVYDTSNIESKVYKRMKNLEVLEKIGTFKQNWNGYGADPIPAGVINVARRFIIASKHIPHVSPTADDSIQLEYQSVSGSCLAFNIHIDLVSSYLEDSQGHESEKEFLPSDFNEMEKMLDEFFM